MCVGSVSGIIKIVDLKRAKVLARSQYAIEGQDASTIFECSWNKENGIIACSENGNLYLIKYTIENQHLFL